MSAYVIDDKTMARVLRAFTACDHLGYKIAGYSADVKRMPEDNKNATLRAIADALYRANNRAVNQRYNLKNKAPKFNGKIPIFNTDATKQELCDIAKALDCLLYQMSEGTVFNSRIFRELERIAGNIGREIARRCSEYDFSPWG
jgi:hypothetical protein